MPHAAVIRSDQQGNLSRPRVGMLAREGDSMKESAIEKRFSWIRMEVDV
jgi:hypothetical protein